MARTLAEKVWADHGPAGRGRTGPASHDLHLLHEVTSPQAFEGLRLSGRTVRRPDLTLATGTTMSRQPWPITDLVSRTQVETLRANCAEFGVRLFPDGRRRAGDRPRRGRSWA